MQNGYNTYNNPGNGSSNLKSSSNKNANYSDNGKNGNNTAAKYKKTSIETADKGKLVVELYKGAIKFMKLARKHIEEDNILEANDLLIRTQQIIRELMSTLDFEQGGKLAANLEALYDHMYFELIRANMKKDTERIKTVEDNMMQLLEAWQKAAQQARKDKRRQEKVAIGMEG